MCATKGKSPGELFDYQYACGRWVFGNTVLVWEVANGARGVCQGEKKTGGALSFAPNSHRTGTGWLGLKRAEHRRGRVGWRGLVGDSAPSGRSSGRIGTGTVSQPSEGSWVPYLSTFLSRLYYRISRDRLSCMNEKFSIVELS